MQDLYRDQHLGWDNPPSARDLCVIDLTGDRDNLHNIALSQPIRCRVGYDKGCLQQPAKPGSRSPCWVICALAHPPREALNLTRDSCDGTEVTIAYV